MVTAPASSDDFWGIVKGNYVEYNPGKYSADYSYVTDAGEMETYEYGLELSDVMDLLSAYEKGEILNLIIRGSGE